MLVVFESKAAAQVLMLAKHALMVVQATGKEVGRELPSRGVFTVAQLPDAIEHLERALAQDEGYVPEDDENSDNGRTHPMEEKVSFTQRAFPLLDMLRKAKEMETEVLWSPADRGW